jgi:hypothetical protein
MFYIVQLWRDVRVKAPIVQKRVQATSEWHAVVQVMRRHHFICVDRAWVSYSANEPAHVRLAQVIVKGKVRIWKHEPEIWTLEARKRQKVAQYLSSLGI